MTNVQQSCQYIFNVRAQPNKSVILPFNTHAIVQSGPTFLFNALATTPSSLGIPFNVLVPVSTPPSDIVIFNTKATVSKSVVVIFNTLATISPAKVLIYKFNVLQVVPSGPEALYFNVRVGVSSPPSVIIPFNTHAVVQQSLGLLFNVQTPFLVVSSNPLTILFHTLTNPTVTQLDTTPMYPDVTPPQIRTTGLATSTLGG